MMFAQSLRHLIDDVIVAGNAYLLGEKIRYVFYALLSFSVFSFVRAYFSNSIADKVVADIKKDVYKRVLELEVRYFSETNQHFITNLIKYNVPAIKNIITSIFSFLIRSGVVFGLSLITMFRTSNTLAGMVVIGILCVAVPLVLFRKLLRKYAQKNIKLDSALDNLITETTSSIKNLYAFNKQEIFIGKIERVVENAKDFYVKNSMLRALFFSVAIFSICSLIVVIIWIAMHDIISGRITSGQLTAFIFCALMMTLSISGIIQETTELQTNFVLVGQVFEWFGSSSHHKAARVIGSDTQIGNVSSIAFNQVCFEYPSRNLSVLQNLDCTFQKGVNVIYGKSGIGKTTIFEILLGFYQIKSGSVVINNVNMDSIDLKTLRSIYGYVPQDPFIFSGTILENILFGTENYDQALLNKVIKISQLEEFASQMPKGLNTFVGTNGQMLSGGQKQRIGIARALLIEPQVLLLDESTNALDHGTEKDLIHKLREYMQDRIIIAITHRRTLIDGGDNVIEIQM